MKKYEIICCIFLFALLTSCEKSEEEKQKEREAMYYLNEDFFLVNAKEEMAGGDNNVAFKVRTWIIIRSIKEHPDSIQQAEIVSTVKDIVNVKKGCGCNDGRDNFMITNELWYGKSVGSKLHFDYIRKDRFFTLPATTINVEELKTVEPVITTEETSTTEDELHLLELERQVEALKLKLSK
jgi:hypothetical protein